MADVCILQNNNKIYNIIGNFILLVLLIIVIYVYFKYSLKKKNIKEKFTEQQTYSTELNNNIKDTDGCFSIEQYNLNVVSRQCAIYLIDEKKKKECDKYFEYYNMTDIQLDNLLNEMIPNETLYNKIDEIRLYNLNNKDNIFQTCKVNYKNWKEINNLIENPTDIYPYKNINNTSYDNFKLNNTCFTDDNTSKISMNNSIVSACKKPFNNINDNNNPDNKYISVNFNEKLSDIDIKNSICNNDNNKLLDVSTNKVFLTFECSYNTLKKELKINNMLLNKYNNNTLIFENIVLNNNIILLFNKLFRLSYNNTSKKIYYGPKKININALMVNYNICKNIVNSTFVNSQFTFKKLNIADKMLEIQYLNDIPELLDLLDTKIVQSDYLDDTENIKKIILNYLNDIIKQNDNLNLELLKYEKDINNMIKEATNENIANYNNRDTAKYINEITSIRTKTDILFNNYMLKIKNTKSIIDNYFIKKTHTENEIQDFIYEIMDENNNNSIIFDKLIDIITKEYDDTIFNLLEIYNFTLNKIKSLYSAGAHFNINFYNNDFIPENQEDLIDILVNLNPDDSVYGIINTIDKDFYYKHKYITNANNIKNCIIEISGNIKLDSGYYLFYIDNESIADFFIGYPNPNDSTKMIFINVANVYNNVNNISKNPIYIDGEKNNGFYGIYLRIFRDIKNTTNKYLNITYKKINIAEVKNSYNLITNNKIEYILKPSYIHDTLSLNNIIYINKNVNPSKLSIYQNILYKNSTNLFPIFENHEKYLLYWWDFDNTLKSKIGNNNLIKNNIIYYNFDNNNKKYGNYSLNITDKNLLNDFKLTSEIIDLSQSFTLSFWANYSSCCNKIISLGDELFINIQKDFDNNDIIYINGISVNTTKQVTKNEEKYELVDECREYYDTHCNYNGAAVADWRCRRGCTEYKPYMYPIYNDIELCKKQFYSTCLEGKHLGDLKRTNSEIPLCRQGCPELKIITVTKTVNIIENVIPASFNTWNHFVLIYNFATKTLKFYYNNVLKFEKKILYLQVPQQEILNYIINHREHLLYYIMI